MSNVATATRLFREGCACSQAILAAYGKPLGLSRQTALHISAGFEAGMYMGQVCGAVAGALMVLGLRHAGPNSRTPAGRAELRARVIEFRKRFKERNGSLICRELLRTDISTPEGMAEAKQQKLFRTRCVNMVKDAAEILEEMEAISDPADAAKDRRQS